MNVQEDLEKLSKEIEQKTKVLHNLTQLQSQFPDLQKYVGRWDKVAYYSKAANSQIQGFDYRRNCGCCADSPYEIWPYLNTEHGKVYSDPPKLWADSLSEEELRKLEFPETIITKLLPLIDKKIEEEDTEEELDL